MGGARVPCAPLAAPLHMSTTKEPASPCEVAPSYTGTTGAAPPGTGGGARCSRQAPIVLIGRPKGYVWKELT